MLLTCLGEQELQEDHGLHPPSCRQASLSFIQDVCTLQYIATHFFLILILFTNAEIPPVGKAMCILVFVLHHQRSRLRSGYIKRIVLNFSERAPILHKIVQDFKPWWWVVANTLAALASFSTPGECWAILDSSDYVECRSPRISHWNLKYLTSQSAQGAQLDHPPSTVGRRLTWWKYWWKTSSGMAHIQLWGGD